MDYPLTRKDAVVDDYFGTPVADPYRWLEDRNSAETRSWVEAQNAITRAFLERLPARDRIHSRLTELWDYARYGVPSREGRWYVFARNDGLQKGPVCR
jgi:prolyl oligopeptidase